MNISPQDEAIVCPGCHTPHPSLTHALLDAGEGWLCSRCGQRWDAGRLATVAAYKAWSAVRNSTGPALTTQVMSHE
jgi:predicted CXXCH cytochrome family protein